MAQKSEVRIELLHACCSAVKFLLSHAIARGDGEVVAKAYLSGIEALEEVEKIST